MSKSVEQSIKHKLKDISKRLNIPFNSLLEMLFLERFRCSCYEILLCGQVDF